MRTRLKAQRVSIILTTIGIFVFYFCMHTLEDQIAKEKTEKEKSERNSDPSAAKAEISFSKINSTNIDIHDVSGSSAPNTQQPLKKLLFPQGEFANKSLPIPHRLRSASAVNVGIPTVSTPAKSLTTGGEDPDPEIRKKRDFIKSMMKDAWTEYSKYAWGENELAPVSHTGKSGDIYGSSKIGATIIDALDTLYIMGFHDEYKKGRDWVETSFNFRHLNTYVSVFETNIRILGGFLSSFALTGDQLFVRKAYEVGRALLPAFNSKHGLPYARVNPLRQAVSGASSVLAELGSLQLEFVYLSKVTGDPAFEKIVRRIQNHMNNLNKPKGLYGNSVDIDTGDFQETYTTMGAGGDSFYEYLLKDWVQNKNVLARKMYDEAIDGFIRNRLIRLSTQQLMYIGDLIPSGHITQTGSHLACFAGGMFALGSVTDPRNGTDSTKIRDMEIAQNFTNTCHESYIRSASRIGPESFRFLGNDKDIEATNTMYILRPEVIESYFVLYRTTGDSKYRDWAWDAAQAIEKHCKVGPHGGYSGLRDVESTSPQKDDTQQTFFLAETLKYLYLIFSAPELISLDYFVFNTEAHPLPIIGTHPTYRL